MKGVRRRKGETSRQNAPPLKKQNQDVDFQIGLMTFIATMKTIMKTAILIMALVASMILKIGTIIVRYLHIHLKFECNFTKILAPFWFLVSFYSGLR